MTDDADALSGLPSRPRSDLECSSVQSALIASLDFHTAVHGHAATMALVTLLLPQIDEPLQQPQSPPPERRVSTVPRKFVKSQEPQERGLLKGPSWADMSSDDEQ